MKYLLDTCCISDFVKGDVNIHKQIKACAPIDLALSSITLLEIKYGLLLNVQRAKKIRKPLEDFISCVAVLPFSEETALYSAEIRSNLRKKGTPIGGYDILIAGTALQNELILVTSNEKEFKRVPKLIIENWR